MPGFIHSSLMICCHSVILTLGLTAVIGCSDYGLSGDRPSSFTPESVSPAFIEHHLCACPEGYATLPLGQGCQGRIEVPAKLQNAYSVCPLIPHVAYGSHGALYPGGTVVSDEYWGQNDFVANGRLNETGVWVCSEDGTSAGFEPINEWIGFSVCLVVEEAGDYLIGVGADNLMSFAVDGEVVLSLTDGSHSIFNYWWMRSISLTAGQHIIEFAALNSGGPAGMGAEISGPFAKGALVDDASMIAQDYDGSLIWTTTDAIGSAFPIGDKSSWACPDGTMTLDICAPEPVCVSEETIPCL